MSSPSTEPVSTPPPPAAYPSAPPAPAYPAYPGYPPLPSGSGPHGPYGPWLQVPVQKSRTMAYWALGLSLLGGILLSTILGIVALTRTRNGGGDGGRGSAIAALVISGGWVLLFVVLAAFGATDGGELRGQDGRVQTTRVVPLSSLRLGDCITVPQRDGFTTVTMLPCSEAHDGEVFDVFSLPGATYPGEDTVFALAEQGCADRFEAFVGEPFDTSQLEVLYGYPTAVTWRSDSSVTCIVQLPGAGLTETLRGSGSGSGSSSDGTVPVPTQTPRPA